MAAPHLLHVLHLALQRAVVGNVPTVGGLWTGAVSVIPGKMGKKVFYWTVKQKKKIEKNAATSFKVDQFALRCFPNSLIFTSLVQNM